MLTGIQKNGGIVLMAYEPRILDATNSLGTTPMFIEIVPPKKASETNRYQKHCHYLKRLFDRADISAVNIPEIQDESKKGDRGKRRNKFKERVSPRKYARALAREIDTNYVINRVSVQASAEEQEKWLLETHHDYNIQAITLVGGESSEESYPGPSVTESNRMIREFLNRGELKYNDDTATSTDYLIGNICIPTRRRSDFDEPDRMMKKVKSGADYFTTQILGESESATSLMRDFSEQLDEEDLEPPILMWSFTPIASKKDVDFLRWLGVYLPDEVEEQILSAPNPADRSIDMARDIWIELNEVNQDLPKPFYMGCNLSVLGMRNFEHAINMADALSEIVEPVV